MHKGKKPRQRTKFLGVFNNGILMRGPAHTLKQANRFLQDAIDSAPPGMQPYYRLALYIQRYEVKDAH